MKREAIVCPVLVVLLLVSVFHMADPQLPGCKGAGGDQGIDDMQPRTIEHRITGSELQLLKSRIGVEEESQNYNQIVYDHGTGLAPLSEADWEEIGKEAYVVEQVPSPTTLPSNVDNSATPWFPPIGNQGSQGSCVAWAVGYYTKTFQEAKEHNWNLSGTTTDEIMSPSFIYNLINNGVDQGSNYYDAIQLVCSVGDCSLAKMPYNAADCTSWPSEPAWKEAPLYRGNDSGFSYMILQNDSDLANLKSWLSSGNLAIISVDGHKIADPTWGWSLLDGNDMLTMDNYVNPNPNHASTIVGYNNNFAYTEQGQTHYGAFKIANSWGIPWLPSPFGWEHILDGCYWISYEAMKQRIGYCMFYRDRTGYVPTLTTSFRIDHPVRGECNIEIGMGTHDNPTMSKSFTDYIHGGNQPFCSNNIVFDITEFEDAVPNIYGKFFLSVYDGGSPATGTILYFSVENTVSSSPPVNTVNGGYVFADLTLRSPPAIQIVNPGPYSRPAKWSASSTARGFTTSNFIFYNNETAVGSTFFINVTISNVTSLKTWGIGVIYDNTTLQYVSAWRPTDHVFSPLEAQGVSIVAPAVVVMPVDASHQEVQWGCAYIMPNPPWTFNGTGELCQIQFRIIVEVSFARPQASSSFTFDPAWTAVYYQPTGTEVPLLGAGSFVYTRVACVMCLVVRGLDNGIYYRTYNSSTDSWGGWSVLPGATLDSPAAAVCNNKLYVVVRGLDGSSLWYGYVDLGSGGFSSWTLLNGATSSAPTLTSNGTALCLVVRGLDNRIYYRIYDTQAQAWQGWKALSSGTTCDKPATAMVGSTLNIVVRGYSPIDAAGNNTLWCSTMNLTNNAFSGWTLLSGATPSSPTLTASQTSNSLYLVVRGNDNKIYYNTWNGANWQGWNVLPTGATIGGPAATIVGGKLCFVVIGMDGTSMWQSSLDIATSSFSGWTLLSGSTPSKPTLTS